MTGSSSTGARSSCPSSTSRSSQKGALIGDSGLRLSSPTPDAACVWSPRSRRPMRPSSEPPFTPLQQVGRWRGSTGLHGCVQDQHRVPARSGPVAARRLRLTRGRCHHRPRPVRRQTGRSPSPVLQGARGRRPGSGPALNPPHPARRANKPAASADCLRRGLARAGALGDRSLIVESLGGLATVRGGPGLADAPCRGTVRQSSRTADSSRRRRSSTLATCAGPPS